MKFEEGQDLKIKVKVDSKRSSKIIKGKVTTKTNYFVCVKTKEGYTESILLNDFKLGRAVLI